MAKVADVGVGPREREASREESNRSDGLPILVSATRLKRALKNNYAPYTKKFDIHVYAECFFECHALE